MDNEAEVIRNQMLETRTSLTEKIEAVEDKLASAVTETTDTVTRTVEAVKGVVESVEGAVEGTVKTVSGAAEEAVESVKETFDVRRQVERHPWLMVGGAVAAGFAGGLLLQRVLGAPAAYSAPSYSGPAYSPPSTLPYNPPPPASGNGASGGKSWFDEISSSLEPALGRLKRLAIGAAVGVVGQMVVSSLPEQVRGQLGEVVDQLTTSLGGEQVKGLEDMLGQHRHSA